MCVNFSKFLGTLEHIQGFSETPLNPRSSTSQYFLKTLIVGIDKDQLYFGDGTTNYVFPLECKLKTHSVVVIFKLLGSQTEQPTTSTACTNSHPVHSHYLPPMKSPVTQLKPSKFSFSNIQQLLLNVQSVYGFH